MALTRSPINKKANKKLGRKRKEEVKSVSLDESGRPKSSQVEDHENRIRRLRDKKIAFITPIEELSLIERLERELRYQLKHEATLREIARMDEVDPGMTRPGDFLDDIIG